MLLIPWQRKKIENVSVLFQTKKINTTEKKIKTHFERSVTWPLLSLKLFQWIDVLEYGANQIRWFCQK